MYNHKYKNLNFLQQYRHDLIMAAKCDQKHSKVIIFTVLFI